MGKTRAPGHPLRLVPSQLHRARREKDPLDTPLTLAPLDHEVPIHVEVHDDRHRPSRGGVDRLIEHDLDSVLAPARNRQLSLDALAYPTIRRRAAQIGDPQRGSNCQLSATTGLPALSVPAGFTDAGLPTGLDLLGRPLEDARFAAQGGRATAHVLFSWDVGTSGLSYEATVSGIPAEEIHGVGLHRAQRDQEGGVIYRLSGPVGQEASGTITLNAGGRKALMGGDLYLRLYTTEVPHGGPRAPLPVP